MCVERKLFDYVSTESSKNSCRTTEPECERASIPSHTRFQQEGVTTAGSNDEGEAVEEAVEEAVTALGELGSDVTTEETPLQSWLPRQKVEGEEGEGGGSVSIEEQIDDRDEAETVFDTVSLLSVLSHNFLEWVLGSASDHMYAVCT